VYAASDQPRGDTDPPAPDSWVLGAEAEEADATAGADEVDEPDEADANDELGGDYYALLRVAPTATDADIRRAFRRQAMRWHPDHFTGASPQRQAEAGRRMRAILAAHRVLSDPVRRHIYDRERSPAPDDGSPLAAPFESEDGGESAYARAAYQHGAPAHTGNTNPAGVLFGTLCIIVAIALGGRALVSADAGLGTLLTVGLVLGLLALAALFFTSDSAVARLANDYLEGEPRVARRAGRAHQQHQHGGTVWNTSYAFHAHVPDEPELTVFETLVDEALAGVPDDFQEYLRNVVVRVKPEPSPREIVQMKLRPCSLLLGLYEGVPLTHQAAHGSGPEVVTIFQRPIETYCDGDPERIRRQVRATVLHELAHHFGMDHDEMPAWVK
jgi:predicted Zn-dependent protease with MMP-like domain